jgi:hypothetical protein
LERIFVVPGYPYYAYDEDNAYQQYASQEQYRQWADYAAQQQYEDSAAQANYYNWAAANSYKQPRKDVLKVASNKNTNKVFIVCVARCRVISLKQHACGLVMRGKRCIYLWTLYIKHEKTHVDAF